MNQEQINKVIFLAVDKYKYLQEETVWIEQQSSNLLVINWHVNMDAFVSEYRVKQISNFLHKHLPTMKIASATKFYFK